MINKKFTHEELTSLWEETFPNTKFVFSDYEYRGDDDFIYPLEDFTSTKPIVKNRCVLSFNTWKHEDNIFSTVVYDLTWKKLIDVLEQHGDDSHVFIENIDIEGDKVFVFLGS